MNNGSLGYFLVCLELESKHTSHRTKVRTTKVKPAEEIGNSVRVNGRAQSEKKVVERFCSLSEAIF